MRALLTRSLNLIFSLMISSGAFAEDAQVMLFGVFHFANPGADMIKTDQINVMTENNQAYLERLTDRIAGFEPTHVLLECTPQRSAQINQQLTDYLAGNFELSSNEIFQLGFRIASKAGHIQIHCYDDREIGWEAENAFEYMANNLPELEASVNSAIAEVTQSIEESHRTLSLEELLILSNDADEDNLNKGFYMMTNSIGAGSNFYGADASASWWH